MLSGAVCIRKSVLDPSAGFRREFFRKAGEYDLSFRIWEAGYSVERFEDVVYRHDKVMTGRSSALAHRMDLRNNLILVERYLPARLRRGLPPATGGSVTPPSPATRAAPAPPGPGSGRPRAGGVREAITGRQTLSPGAVEGGLRPGPAGGGRSRDWARRTASAAWSSRTSARTSSPRAAAAGRPG